MEIDGSYSECSKCARKAESYRCPYCGLTGDEIYVKRWEAAHGEKHPSNWVLVSHRGES